LINCESDVVDSDASLSSGAYRVVSFDAASWEKEFHQFSVVASVLVVIDRSEQQATPQARQLTQANLSSGRTVLTLPVAPLTILLLL
jgi:hypothetical protein